MNRYLGILGAITLLWCLSPSPTLAHDHQGDAMPLNSAGGLLPVSMIDAFHAGSILNMRVKKALAIVVGVGVGVYLVDNFVPVTLGIPPEILGILLGALLGNWWYENSMPPFG
jgi:hypothetical protein